MVIKRGTLNEIPPQNGQDSTRGAWSDCVAWISEWLQPDHLVLPLREADVLRTPEFQHPVQCVHGNGNLGCSTPISAGS